MIDWIFFLGAIGATSVILISFKKRKPIKKSECLEKASHEMIWVCGNCGAGFEMSVGKNPICCPWCGKSDLEQIEKDFDDTGYINICPNCGEIICSMCLPTDIPKICPSCMEQISKNS